MIAAPSQGFPRSARLKRRRLIQPLFERGSASTLAVGCVRLLYRMVKCSEAGTDTPVQVGFAPGRQPSAVRRNRLRRIMRETWRLQPPVRESAKEDQVLTVMVVLRRHGAEAQLRRDLTSAVNQLRDRINQSGQFSGS